MVFILLGWFFGEFFWGEGGGAVFKGEIKLNSAKMICKGGGYKQPVPASTAAPTEKGEGRGHTSKVRALFPNRRAAQKNPKP